MRVGKGFARAAEVTLSIDLADMTQLKTAIETATSGRGFFSQGYAVSIPATGYDEWREAAVEGARRAMEEAGVAGRVVITDITGWPTDTTPARIIKAAMAAVRNALKS
jgi:hypothetical protein